MQAIQRRFAHWIGMSVTVWVALTPLQLPRSTGESRVRPIGQVDQPSESAHARSRSIHLVIEDGLAAAIRNQIPPVFKVTEISRADVARIDLAASEGDSLVWIGEGSSIPRDLWVGNFKPAVEPLRTKVAEHSPLLLNLPSFRPSSLSAGFIRPPKETVYHKFLIPKGEE